MAEDIYEVDQIIGRRLASNGKEDYLVHWQHFSPLLSTWEPVSNFSACLGAVKDFYDQHWPIPGSQATEVVHLQGKPSEAVNAKQELLTLQNLPARKGKKLLRGLRKDLKDEILRLQSLEKVAEIKPVEEKLSSSSNNHIFGKNGIIMNTRRSSLEKTTPTHLESKKPSSLKRKNKVHEFNLKPTTNDMQEPVELQQTKKLLKRNNPNYLKSVKEKKKELKKSPFHKRKHYNMRGKDLVDITANNNEVIGDHDSSGVDFHLGLPSRVTRQTLPSCSAARMLDEELVVTTENRCMYIKFCNEAKKNVINLQMCEKMISSLHDAGKDDVSLVVFTGSGSSFCFGWDLDQFNGISQHAKPAILQKYRLMVRLLLTCPKPLVAAVNGPAAAFGLSLVCLCDIVLADSQATFETKFSEWGHPPVGCCTYTLPRRLGQAKAISMLLLNNQLSATLAHQAGLVTEVLDKDFNEQLKSNVKKLLSIPTQCLQDTRKLLHEGQVQDLSNVNTDECDFFQKYISHDSTLNNIIARWRSSIEN